MYPSSGGCQSKFLAEECRSLFQIIDADNDVVDCCQHHPLSSVIRRVGAGVVRRRVGTLASPFVLHTTSPSQSVYYTRVRVSSRSSRLSRLSGVRSRRKRPKPSSPLSQITSIILALKIDE